MYALTNRVFTIVEELGDRTLRVCDGRGRVVVVLTGNQTSTYTYDLHASLALTALFDHKLIFTGYGDTGCIVARRDTSLPIEFLGFGDRYGYRWA